MGIVKLNEADKAQTVFGERRSRILRNAQSKLGRWRYARGSGSLSRSTIYRNHTRRSLLRLCGVCRAVKYIGDLCSRAERYRVGIGRGARQHIRDRADKFVSAQAVLFQHSRAPALCVKVRILQLARMLDEKAKLLTQSGGQVNENMLLAMVGLLLADELTELRKGNPSSAAVSEGFDKQRLAEIDKAVVVGKRVAAGERLGQMGRSAPYSIGKAQAHLHFEIGLRLGDHFDKWYKTKKYKEKNFFGNFNGINLVGFDPLAFFQAAKDGKINNGFAGYINDMPTAFVVRVYTKDTPDFVKIYPALTDRSGEKVGWDIHFVWYGMPKKFERIKDPRPGAKEGEVELIKYNPDELQRKCRRMVVFDKKGDPKMTEDFKEQLKRIFTM